MKNQPLEIRIIWIPVHVKDEGYKFELVWKNSGAAFKRIIVGLHSGQQADKVETPCTELGHLDMEVTTHGPGGLEEKQTARLGADDEFLAKEFLVSVELERPEKSSTLDYNIFTPVKDST
ncbi:hypothetical protein POM88_027169 [Heracleum sosnowskyi]|uniref:Uncharacterized protein n=1 Tax=Heracleum sosnowskyi TaxID=360622 RepID=A0AAD8IAG6_9APIA|nr:hypothetical protein POM88_027169 [Heracleum sosnowskyi]